MLSYVQFENGPRAFPSAGEPGLAMAQILSISFDLDLLRTRELLLRRMGHSVISADGFAQVFRVCERHNGKFDLIILGHSIPPEDKRLIIDFLKDHSCPVLALLRPYEEPAENATRSIVAEDPGALLAAVEELLG